MRLRLVCLLIFAPMLACAQDAGLVLRTLVSYRTVLAGGGFTPEQKAEAERLGQAAQAEAAQGKFAEAMRQYGHGFAVMQGATWTPGLEMATALKAKAEHQMLEPGQSVTITLKPMYAVDPSAKVYVRVRAMTVPVDRANQGLPSGDLKLSLPEGQPIEAAKLPVTLKVQLPPGDGNFVLTTSLTESPDVDPKKKLPSGAVKIVMVHVEADAAQVAQLRKRLAALKTRTAPALPTAEYAVTLYEQADADNANPAEYKFDQEFANANRILDAIEAGKDPWAGQVGDQRRAYRSSVDGSLQPYRLYIPEGAGKQPVPLVVALHGMGGDENSMFDGYDHGALKTQAAKHGFAVVCPKGREPASMYRGAAEQDVLDVLAEVERALPVETKRVYLMGHSMGAYGTWSTAMDHPDLFAGLGLISGGGNPAGMEKIKAIPQYVVHGDDDKTVNVAESRKMVEAGKKAGTKIEYVEVPRGSHVSVAVPAFAPMLDFFAQQKRGD